MLASTVLKYPRPLPATRCARGGRGEDPSWTRNAAEAERPVARRATHLRNFWRRCSIGLPVPVKSMRDCRRNDQRQKTHFASRLKRITPVQLCREKYFSFCFSEIDVS
jgi:hypothetical protein